MVLYRPVGLAELDLIIQAEYRAFPPRLPEQPIFYPVLSFDYAKQIAVEWNSTSPPFAGFVTRFDIDDDYVSRFPVQRVGNDDHLELWVPSEELNVFNQNLVGTIDVIGAWYGDRFDEELMPDIMISKL